MTSQWVCSDCIERSTKKPFDACNVLGMVFTESITSCKFKRCTSPFICDTCTHSDKFKNVASNARLCCRNSPPNTTSLIGCGTITDVQYEAIKRFGCKFYDPFIGVEK